MSTPHNSMSTDTRGAVTYTETDRVVHLGRDLLSQATDLLPAAFEGIFVVTTDRLVPPVDSLVRSLGDRHVGTQVGATVHVPVAEVEATLEEFDRVGARSLVAVGGGSAIGLGKSLARRRGVSLAAVPTTYAGSEMTPVWGETSDGRKTTGRDDAVRPRVVLYDVALTETMSSKTAVASAMNALAHAMEALYAPDATPVSDALARRAVHLLSAAGSALAKRAQEQAHQREQSGAERDTSVMALEGAWLAGQVLGSTTMSLHHKLCHLLGGAFNLPHADTHAVLLPHVLATCATRAPQSYEVFADALETADPEKRLVDIAAAAGVPTSLHALGVTEEQVNHLASELHTSDQGHYNFSAERAEGVLRTAWRGPV